MAKSIIFELLSKDDCLQDRTKLCLKELMLGINMCLDNTYIQFKNQFYKQIFGVPMGSPISATIANLVMETVETKALQTFQNSPIMWKRYICGRQYICDYKKRIIWKPFMNIEIT